MYFQIYLVPILRKRNLTLRQSYNLYEQNSNFFSTMHTLISYRSTKMLIEIFYFNQSLKIAISKIMNFVNNNFVNEVLNNTPT